MFEDFEEVSGLVGAAKCLRVLAPRFFPLWGGAIAKAYDLPLRRWGQNAELYVRFMRIARRTCEAPPDESVIGQLPLKALDKYNYCRYAKHWVKES